MVKKKKQSSQVIVIVSVIILDGVIWHGIIASVFARIAESHAVAHDYFLDVDQGESELTIFPDNIKVLSDAGSTDAVVGDLESVLPQGDNYIDLAIISDPELDRFGGFGFVLDHYRVGAFVYDGRDDADPPSPAWSGLLEKIKEKGVPLITLGRGDVIHDDHDDHDDDDHDNDYDNEIAVLSPDLAFDQSADLSDASLALLVKTPQFSTLLMSDAGVNVEEWLIANHDDVRATVLEGDDHDDHDDDAFGYAYFLRAVNPAILVTAANPKTAHAKSASTTAPSVASSTHALILTTAQNGTIELYPENGKLKVVKEK